MSRPLPRVPLTPKEGWLSDGRQVLRFRPTRWERQVHQLEITTGELLPDQSMIPVLWAKTSAKRWKRRESSREEAIKTQEETY
jgi:hypothetical protein